MAEKANKIKDNENIFRGFQINEPRELTPEQQKLMTELFKSMNERGKSTAAEASNVERISSYARQKHQATVNKLLRNEGMEIRAENNELLQYLKNNEKEKMKQRPEEAEHVNIPKHFEQARAKRMQKQIQLAASMQQGAQNQQQRLLEDMAYRNEVREVILRTQPIKTRGQALANTYPLFIPKPFN